MRNPICAARRAGGIRLSLVLFAVAGLSLLLAACGGGGGGGTPPPPPPAGVDLYPTTGSGPEDVVLGDFDGDGDQDVATANTLAVDNTSAVTLFENPGNGKLLAGVSVGVAPPLPAISSIALAVGRLDADAKDDLVVLFVDGDSYAVVPGGATITAMAATTPTVVSPAAMASSWPQALALGNFDASVDGFLDLAVALSVTDQVLIFTGNVDGTFGPTTITKTFSTGASPWSLAAGDLNGDAGLDLAVVALSGTPGPTPTDPLVYGFLGNTFVTPVAGEASTASWQDADLAVGDVNGDGFADAVRTFYDTGAVGVFWATTTAGAQGDLTSHTAYGAIAAPRDVVLADDDGDGDLDIFVTGGGATGGVSVLPNDGVGAFGAATVLDTYATPVALAVGDLDGNVTPDIVTVHPASGQIAVRLRP